MSSPRDRPGGEYICKCDRCGHGFGGHKGEHVCMVCLPAAILGFREAGNPVFAAACEMCRELTAEVERLREDAARLDWLDSQGDGSPWIARQSTTGRGYRLHNSGREGGAATVRDAIDKARAAAGQ